MTSRCSISVVLLAAVLLCGSSRSVTGHGPHPDQRLSDPQGDAGADKAEADHYFRLFTSLVAEWPLTCREQLIAQAAREQQFLKDDPAAPDAETILERRQQTLESLRSLIPEREVILPVSTAHQQSTPLVVCRGIPTLFLVRFVNRSANTFVVREPGDAQGLIELLPTRIPANTEVTSACRLAIPSDSGGADEIVLELETAKGDSHSVTLPIQMVDPARLSIRWKDDGESLPDSDATAAVVGKLTVRCSDGVCRYGGPYATKSTFTEKPIIYPTIGTWQKVPSFYCDKTVELDVPPGATQVTFERGFEHARKTTELTLKPGEVAEVQGSCDRLVDLFAQGWVSGDTHVHWVTNAWNVDEPLSLLSMAQRAEDLRVANNLTLLQRYANQAFVKPSQAPMGPVSSHSGPEFHLQMGEEYRNEDLYGHLCFLNIDWLVQPIGTGSIIAGPDALDYPINRTAIEACRVQGGISIEAHGTGGNKDVPVNVIHRLTDSLDQMEPEMYYRLLDCGFRIPLTNGSDHPARTLGIARAYVKVERPFSYGGWIEGIRQGRTFTTSGPLLSLEVNGAEIGDLIHAGSTDQLHIKASAVSRDPIGTFQIVSNGEVVFSQEVGETHCDFEISVPARSSRWIVARCSNRDDGRADFGFGNFNAITGPGVAHTSPIYVQVDGVPRFDQMAADFWQGRMKRHADEIRARGRFANEDQREEAVGYIEQGRRMFRGMEEHVRGARSRTETAEQTKDRLQTVIRRFGKSSLCSVVLEALEEADSVRALHDALAPLVLLKASVNPESRVKIAAAKTRIKMKRGRPQRFLLAVENTAGVTAPIQIETHDLASDPPGAADWCRVDVIDSPFTSLFLTGAEREYKVIELLVREAGLREVRLIANVGQGTQDLGFCATADLMIDTETTLHE